MNVAWAIPLLIVLQTRSTSVSPRPVAWAAQSPRPASCLAAPGLWEVSRQAMVERGCRELSRGQALLLRAPQKAHAVASALILQEPKLVAARVLRGRASLRLGQARAALADLLPLIAEGAEPPADPSALLDGGRSALAESELALAARFYRVLGGRASLLPDRTQQTVAYLEIASVLLATQPTPGDEVLGYLREAKRRAVGSGFSGLSVALTALAWSLKGRDAEALAALAELEDPWSITQFESTADVGRVSAELLPASSAAPAPAGSALAAAPLVWLPDGLLHATLGLCLERRDAALSRAHYAAFRRSALAGGPISTLVTRRLGQEPARRAPR